MKTEKEIKTSIHILESELLEKRQKKIKIKTKEFNDLRALKSCLMYVQTKNTTDELLESEIERLEHKLNVVSGRFEEWKNNLTRTELSKILGKEVSTYNRLFCVSELKFKLSNLRYIKS